MNIIITTKNTKASDYLKDMIEKKLSKLKKYFADDIAINVMLSEEGLSKKMEATIKAKGVVFRAEDKSEEFYDSIDKIVEKLSNQMSKFKKKMQKKYQEHTELVFDEWPDAEAENEITISKTKKFDLVPMSVEEAVLQMELVGHDFFIFLNEDSGKVNVVYKRKDKDYGLLEPAY